MKVFSAIVCLAFQLASEVVESESFLSLNKAQSNEFCRVFAFESLFKLGALSSNFSVNENADYNES